MIDIATLNKRIEALDLSPVYIFTGEDVFRKNIATKKILDAVRADDFNVAKEDCSKVDMDAVLTTANTAPVFNAQRVIILKQADKLRAGTNAKKALGEYIDNPLSTTVMVIHYDDVKKWKTEKEIKGAKAVVVEFAELKGPQLNTWISNKIKEKKLTADYDAVDALVEQVGGDMAALESEIEKLFLYKQDSDNKITSKDVLACVGFNKEENPYALSNAIMAQDRNTALKLIASLLNAGEEPVGLLNQISSCVIKMTRIKRLVNRGVSASEIPSKAGLMFWEGRLVEGARRFPPEEVLLRTLDKTIDADMLLKSSSGADPAVLLRGLILSLFSK